MPRSFQAIQVPDNAWLEARRNAYSKSERQATQKANSKPNSENMQGLPHYPFQKPASFVERVLAKLRFSASSENNTGNRGKSLKQNSKANRESPASAFPSLSPVPKKWAWRPEQ